MPPKRKRGTYNSTRPGKRRRTGIFVPTAVVNARKGYTSVARTRGGQVTGEMKYFDSVRENVAIAASATWANTVLDPNVYPVANMNCLFAPTQGAGVNQRIGKACNMLKVKLNGLITMPAQTNQALADAGAMIRLMLVMDKQSNSAQMTGTQLMTSPGVASAALAPLTHQNIDNFGRFIVLKDKMIMMADPNTTWDGTNVEQGGLIRRFKLNHKFRSPVQVRFNNTNGGTIADIVDYSLHVIAITSNTDLNPFISYACRINYKE